MFSTQKQSQPSKPLQQLFVPIISIDLLSKDYRDLPVDDILALGDQALLYQLLSNLIASEGSTSESRDSEHSCAGASGHSFTGSAQGEDPWFRCKAGFLNYIENEQRPSNSYELTKCSLSQPITQPAVLGPLIDNLYGTLESLKTRTRCELLLYLSGHGLGPDNICRFPDAKKPHPAMADLRSKDAAQCYPDECKQDYLSRFYEAFRKIEAYKGPLGFVGGELYVHQRGFVGVLGVLGLWCHALRECKADTYHHLVIVADCCFAGIWGATLERIMKSENPCLEEYRKLLLKYPVSIQCATNEIEAARGGLFTPLWYFLQKADPSDLDQLRASPKKEPAVTQQPGYVSTSTVCPSWKFFNDSTLFADLHGAQLKQLEEYIEVRQDNCPLLVRPFIVALASEAQHLQEELKNS